MPTSQNQELAILQRRQQVADLYLQCLTQAAIAERLAVDQSTISGDLKAIRRQWRDSTVRDFDLAKAEELEKIDRVEREAWTAWEQSKKPAQSAVVNGEAAGHQARKTIKNRHGDPRMLDIILKCIAARRELLGLDAPTRIAPVMPDGQKPYRMGVEHLTMTELRVLKRVRDRAQVLEHEPEDPSHDSKDEISPRAA